MVSANGEELPDVVQPDGHPISQAGGAGLGVDRFDALGRVVEGVHVEPAAGEVERVAALARAQLEHCLHIRSRELVGAGDHGIAGLVAVHVGMGGESGRPVLSLLVSRRHDDSVIRIPARRHETRP